MSAKAEKALRKLYRVKQGITKQDERGQRAFEAEIAALRAGLAEDTEIRSLAPKRRALAWVTLFLFFFAIGCCVAAALGAQ